MALLFMLDGRAAEARRYPITRSDASGTWIGTRQGLLHATGELFKRYDAGTGLPSSEVTALELDTRSVWVATPAGLARLDKGSRRWEVFAEPQLPSREVTSVSADPSDPDHLWVGTRRGLADYNVRTNTWTRFGARSGGLPNLQVNDVLFRGRTVWAATDAGLAAFDQRLGTWTVYTQKDGLASDKVIEIDEAGADLWLTCATGLSRMNLQRRSFVSFRRKEGLPGTRLLSLARMQNLIYFVTDGGLITYDTSSDALAPFLHARGLQGARVTSVVAAGGFLWFATADKGLARFEPTKKSWEHYKQEDGLSNERLAELSVAGNFLMVFGSRGELDTYDYKKDEWVDRATLIRQAGAAATAPGATAPSTKPGLDLVSPVVPRQPLKLSVSAELNTELKQDLRWPRTGPFSREGYWLVNTLRLGAGAQWPSGRSLDFSGSLDWGDIAPIFDGNGSTLKTFQRYDAQLRYLGAPRDLVQQVLLTDKLRLELEGVGTRLLESTQIEGGQVVLATGAPRTGGKAVTVQAAAGLRRGTPLRLVLRRPSVGSLQNKSFKLLRPTPEGGSGEVRYVIPSSVRVFLDGKELERNVDYFMDHENGVLWLKNTDLLNGLRTIEVELEYEQIPRKNIGAVAMTDLLPRDGDIGKIKRSGPSRWAKDEQGLFDEIDGGAEQYINRGWVTTLTQEFEWGSAGIILRIHDMGEEKNAQSILNARKLPDAKPVPGLEGFFIEKQAASLSIKGGRGQFYIELSIDQASMEQEILSIAFWLNGKASVSGSTQADALRDLTLSASAALRPTDRASLSLAYLGTRSVDDAAVKRAYGAIGRLRDLIALGSAYSRRLGRAAMLSADFEAAASSAAEDGIKRASGNGLQGSAQLTSSAALVRVSARRYSEYFEGVGVARQTEFCRAADGDCNRPGTSQLDHELGLEASVRPLAWLPFGFNVQRQVTNLGRDWADAPADRTRSGTRHIALGQVALERRLWPKIVLGGGYIGREDALSRQDQLRGNSGLELDLADTWLRRLKWKKIYFRGLYEVGRNKVDEFRIRAEDERDRNEVMHHVVAEARLAPTLTESGYATLEYQRLRGALDSGGLVTDLLSYWRLDAGAGSARIHGLAARFDSTLWFGDDQPPLLQLPGAALPTGEEQRKQEANSTLAGVMDIFPGEWIKKLGPLKLNAAYTYTRQTAAQAVRRLPPSGIGLSQREVCGNGIDDDGNGLTDCEDPKCALSDVCLLRTGQLKSHRAYGTLYWDTPGKLQAEIFGDWRRSSSDRDDIVRSTRLEVRSYVTWRPIYPSPITLRFDVAQETKRPDLYDALADPPRPEVISYEPALEWRRRWSQKWWHLAKLAVSHSRTLDLPHIRTIEDEFGRKGDLERLDYYETALKPSIEIRRRFENERSTWNVRPYVRASYKLQWGTGQRSRLDNRVLLAGQPGMSDGSETSRTLSLSLGFIWVHSEHVFVDFDATASWYDCVHAPSGSSCNDSITLTPRILATARY